MLVFVEFLTLRTWTFAVLPALLRSLLRKGSTVSCLYIDATRLGLFAARLSASCLTGLSVDRLNFRLIDVRDESGLLSRLKIPYFDLLDVQNDAASEPEFRQFAELAGNERLKSYVFKSLATASETNRQTMWRVLYVVQVCAWSKRQRRSDAALLFLESRPWFETVRRYAEKNGIKAVPVWRSIDWRTLPIRVPPPRIAWALREIRERLLHARFGWAGLSRIEDQPKPSPAMLATQYWANFNLDRPECFSDLFFWQESELQGNEIVMLLGLPSAPLDSKQTSELAAYGMRAVALNSLATLTPSVPLYSYWPQLHPKPPVLTVSGRFAERRWIKRQVSEYWLTRDYWAELFRRQNVKLFTTWFRFDGAHCAIGDAIRSVGGILAIYQRACQPDAGPEVAIDADISFGYAPFDAEVDRRSGSTVRYHVSVGYFGDHRFPLLRKQASELRERMRSHGVQFILAFFDENSNPDERWQTGVRFQAENYEFLLEKVLADPSLGLILKPKTPPTLRKRLGPVAKLLEQAIATGRCFMFEEGMIQGIHPPSAAALAADVAIHGHLCGATAGLEAALAGTPTLLLDREGWPVSEMYKLGVGRVVFQSWPKLWEAMGEHRNHKSIEGFGDWSSMLGKFDPFQDGRGAERMGTYMKWLLDGLNAGRDRDTVMAEAANRYREMWGFDKVVEIGPPAKTYDLAKEITIEP